MNEKILRKRFKDKFNDVIDYLESDEALEYFIDCMKRSTVNQRARVLWQYFSDAIENLLIEEEIFEEEEYL